MNPRSLIVVVLALVCGLSAVFLVQALRSPVAAPTIERTGVVFAIADVPAGEVIAESAVEVRQVPVEEVPEDAIRKVADAVDRAAKATIDKGDMLRQLKLAEKGTGRGMAALIKPGMRAFTIQTPSFSSSLAGLLQPGNKVDVLLTASAAGDAGGEATLTLLQDVEILAVHTNVNQTASNKINPDDARSVTLQVSPEDARKLDLGQNRGTLHLTLRNPADKGRDTAGTATLADIQGLKPKKEADDPPAVEPLDRKIAPGKQAFTIDATSFSATLAGHLVADSRVDVLLTIDTTAKDEKQEKTSQDGAGGIASQVSSSMGQGPDALDKENKRLTGGATTRTLIKDAKVLLVQCKEDRPNLIKGPTGIDSRYVTLEVDPAQARQLDLGQQMGKLHLSLRSALTPKPAADPVGPQASLMALARPASGRGGEAGTGADDAPLAADRTVFNDLKMIPQVRGPRVLAEVQVRTLRGTRAGKDGWTIYESGRYSRSSED